MPNRSPIKNQLPTKDAGTTARQLSLTVVLVRPEQPRNIGAAVRAAANFGVVSLRLVSPARWNLDSEREARVASSGGWDHLRVELFDTIEHATRETAIVAGTTARNRTHPARPQTPAEFFAQWPITPNNPLPGGHSGSPTPTHAAILFGPESQGLSSADLQLCHALIQIPTNPSFSSLNLAQAVLLVLYEARRAQPQEDERPLTEAATDAATVGEQEALIKQFTAPNTNPQHTAQLRNWRIAPIQPPRTSQPCLT